jgi:rhomboid family GlyGly-CTERM serine protease
MLLRYERAALGAGQLWRLLTAHFIHLNGAHLLVNLAGIVLVWALVVEEFSATQWLWIGLAAIAGIDAGLWWLSPAPEWYAGASGLLHGVLCAGFVAGAWRRDPVSLLGLPILLGKLLMEQRGGTLGITDAMPVVSVAHLYGAVAAGVAAAALRIR